MEDTVKQIIEKLPTLESGKRLVVGIDGLSRSGKTTLTGELMRHFEQNGTPAASFHLDDFIVERNRRYGTGYKEWHEYYHLQWETDWLREHFFKRLKEEDELTLPFYDGKVDRRESRKVAFPDAVVILIEGVFLQRREWKSFYDFVIYVDSPRQKRFGRETEMVQENITKFRNRYWPAEEHYKTAENPQTYADLIVRN